jgi:bacillolysin
MVQEKQKDGQENPHSHGAGARVWRALLCDGTALAEAGRSGGRGRDGAVVLILGQRDERRPLAPAQLVRQVDGSGATRTVFGALFEGLSVDTRPTLSAQEARHVVEAATAKGAEVVGEPELVVLPLDNGVFLTYMFSTSCFSPPSLMRYFVDAHSSAIVFSYEDLKHAVPVVGIGTGNWGDRKKLATRDYEGRFLAEDYLRPAVPTTYNMKFQFFIAGNEAQDADNDWTDGMVVDAHNYAGVTYDYCYQRHGRKGIDDKNMPVRSYVHLWREGPDAFNAGWDDFHGMLYGDGGLAPWGVRYAPFSAALDVVAHEMSHGVTSRTWNGVYRQEPGALNEAFSDIMGTSVEFFAQPVGSGRQQADYWLGEDLAEPFSPARYAFRSMANPSLFCHGSPFNICDPDHYSKRYIGPSDEGHDMGGVHFNSGIANQAFYLLVEGGRNRTSGLSVSGLGSANRAKAEKIFYRGFTLYLTPTAQFSDARRATIQAAADLYGSSGTEVQQVQAAWTAVGVE